MYAAPSIAEVLASHHSELPAAPPSRLLTKLVGVVLALSLLAGAYRWRAAGLRTEALRRWDANLSAVADATKRAIGVWIAERLADGRVAAEYAGDAGILSSRNAGSDARSVAYDERLRRHLGLMAAQYGYEALWILDALGGVRMRGSGGPAASAQEILDAQLAMREGAERFAPPALQPDGAATVTLSVPVIQGREAIGAVVMRIDLARKLFPLLGGPSRLGPTADVRLVVRLGDEVALLTPLDSPPSPPLSLRSSWSATSEVSKTALGGREGFGAFVNTTGVPILAATRYINETGWGLISRVEQREAFAATGTRLRTEGFLALAVLGTFALGFVALGRSAKLAQLRDRIQASAALEVSEARYRRLVESSLDLICTHDLDGVIQSMNPAAARSLGLASPSDAVGRGLDGFLAPAVRHLFSTYLARIRAVGMDTGLMRVVTRDGEERIWEYRNTLVEEQGGEPYILGHARDITEGERAEQALRRSEQSYRSLVERAMYGIYRSTPEGRFLAVNPALVRMLGYASETELLAIDVKGIYADPGERQRLIERYSHEARAERVEVRWKRKDASVITVRLSGTPVRDQRGNVESFEMIAEDVTERRTLEEQLRQAQKMEAIGQLTGGIAHDFNNLLTVILSNADLIDKSFPAAADEVRSDLEDLRGAARRGAAMVRKLLAYSRREDLRPRAVELSRLVTDLTGVLRRLLPEHITLETCPPDGPCLAQADPGSVEQIVLNLVTNARDAMPAGGKLTIVIAEAAIDGSYAASRGWSAPGDYVRLSVADTGTGMDEETLAHVFEPFFTTKPPGIGTGLGMSMVYGLVKQQRGFIELDSHPDRGTTVAVFLPAAAGNAPADLPRATDMPGGSETILLVEDEEGIRRSASRILAKFGYRVLLAADGQEALDVYHQYNAAVDLVISDVVMPRLGGRALYQRLQQESAPPKFLFTSGYAARDVHDRGALDATVPLIPKPWNVVDFLRRVRQTLDEA